MHTCGTDNSIFNNKRRFVLFKYVMARVTSYIIISFTKVTYIGIKGTRVVVIHIAINILSGIATLNVKSTYI